MISLNEVNEILMSSVRVKGIGTIDIMKSLGRTLGEDIYSDIEMPPFNKSAMDGFAVNSKDLSKKFKIVETIPAGAFPQYEIGNGECSKIMTGAPLPKGADRVIKVEVTEEKEGYMYVKSEDRATNVCIRGEDMKIGDRVLEKGRILSPQHIGILASAGKKEVKVYNRVSIGVISTGTEIVDPGSELKPGNIYNSNLYSVSSQVLNSGFNLTGKISVKDDHLKIRKEISAMLDKADVLLITGGVSMGEFDYVPKILEEIGFKIHFHKVSVKPGKPTLFASGMNKWIFGLPGNPVSTFVIFEVIVKPFLYKIGGHSFTPFNIKGIMKQRFGRKKTERDLFIPVIYNSDGTVEAVEYHGSAHLKALENTNGILKVEKGVAEIPAGSDVYVRQI